MSKDTQAAQSTTQFLTFRLGGEDYAMPILQVQEIKGGASFTPLPDAPPWVRGVMNLRGAIVPVYDLRLRFGLPAPESARAEVVVVTNVGARICGLIVDAVSFLTGMLLVDGRLVAVLDVERVCAVREHAPAAEPA